MTGLIWGAAAILLIGAALGFWFWILPNYLFGFLIKRKDPLPGSPGYEQKEAEARKGEPPQWIDEVPHEEAAITSREGLSLKGLFFPAPDKAGGGGQVLSPATIIMAHGYAGDPRQISGLAQELYQLSDYNLLLPWARGCGASQGDYIGFGWPDRLDYLGWINWVKERTAALGPARIILYGVSMGGATVIMTAGEGLPPEVKGVIEDCGFTSVADELWHQMKLQYHFQSPGLLKRVSALSKQRAGYSFEEASPLDQVKKIQVPVLFIHGEGDTFVPPWMGRALYEACAAPKDLYTVKEAGHGEACGADPEEYRRRIREFLARCP
jgi:fermentation-respiration switch protein FrsA (DUF1100 family)